MPYSLPPGILDGLSGNHIVGTVNTVIIGAPGATLCFRIYGYTLGVDRASTGNVQELLFETTTGNTFAQTGSLNQTSVSTITVMFPYPGIQLTLNNGITLASVSTVATGRSVSYRHTKRPATAGHER